MKRTDPQMRIRLPEDVKIWLEVEAARNMRTQNAEIVLAIRQKMATTGDEIGVLAPAEAETHNTHKESCSAQST